MDKEFAFLENWPAEEIAELLADETPSVIATTLKALSRELNTKVFLKLPAEHRDEIAAAMATAKVPGSLLEIMRGEIAAGLQAKAAGRRPGGHASRPAAAASTSVTDKPRPAAAPTAPQVPANPLREMLAHLSPKLRHTLEETSVLPPAPEKPRPAGPAPFTGTDFSQHNSGEVFASAPVESRRAEEIPLPQSTESPSPESRAAENYEKGLRRQTAIDQILQRRRDMGVKNAPTVQTPPAVSRPAVNPLERFRQKAIKDEIAVARRMAAQGAAEKIDGLALAANIVREAGVGVRDNILHAMPQLYQALKQRMFVFDDLLNSPDKTLAVVFSGIKPEIAAMALRFAPDALRERVMRVVPSRRAELINEEITHAAGQVRLADIENSQQAVIDFAVALQSQGKVIIDARDADLVR